MLRRCSKRCDLLALLSRKARTKSPTFSFRGLAYEPNAPSPGDRLRNGAVNVILDFRYTKSPLLEWYFDHHVSAFQEPGSREHFAHDGSGKKFHDGQYGSCTKFMMDVFRDKFGWQAPDLDDLVHWADVVDAARFPNADVASGLDHPALEITAVVQEQGDDTFCTQLIPRLASEPSPSPSGRPPRRWSRFLPCASCWWKMTK